MYQNLLINRHNLYGNSILNIPQSQHFISVDNPNNYGLIKTMYMVNVFVIWKESTPISIDIINIMTKSFEKYNTTF